MIEAVVFDLDGVLLESMHAHAAAWRSAFAEVGVEVTARFILENEGALDWELIRKTNGWEKLTNEADFIKTCDRQRAIYNQEYAEVVLLYPAAAALVERLKAAGLPLALATSSPRAVLTPVLWDWLSAHFDHVVTGDQVKRSKPDPEPYRTAVEAIGAAPETTAAIENAPAGIASAQGAGLTCLAVATTLSPTFLSQADRVFGDHDELAQWLTPRIKNLRP
jgi:beta-phosphoglucomutase